LGRLPEAPDFDEILTVGNGLLPIDDLGGKLRVTFPSSFLRIEILNWSVKLEHGKKSIAEFCPYFT